MNQTSEKLLPPSRPPTAPIRPWLFGLAGLAALALSTGVAQASIAYGSINNFDTVNDTGVPCHGFEIELEDIESTDITTLTAGTTTARRRSPRTPRRFPGTPT